MSQFRKRSRLAAVAIGIAGLSTVIVFAVPPVNVDKQPADDSKSDDASPQFLANASNSCSAAACHGAIQPGPNERTRQIEYTIWRSLDPHAKAAKTLFEPDGLAMVIERNLAHAGHPPIPPFEDVRCLACHSSPVVEPTSHTIAWNRQGIGCEGCHGSTGDWVYEHYVWPDEVGNDNAQRKQRYDATGMKWLGDSKSRATACASCHVGAPAEPMGDGESSWPVRDVTHDLIAAGHPRLSFDFDAYMEALPPHWTNADLPSDPHSRNWAGGEWAAAEAHAKLLKDRAQRDTWPDLAQWQCYGCHHQLTDSNESARPRQTRDAGAMPWAGPGVLALETALAALGATDDSGDLLKKWNNLEQAMHSPAVTSEEATRLANEVLQALNDVPYPDDRQPIQSDAIKKWIRISPENNLPINWEDAAAKVSALGSWLRDHEVDQEQWEKWKELMDKLQFPTGFSSPSGYQPVDSDALDNAIEP